MYESPILLTERIVTDAINEIGRKRDEAVFQAVCECGITVDKEKLLEALNCSHKYYTRGYDDGFKDGAAKAVKEFAERVIKEGEKNVDYYTPEGCDLFFKNGTSCGYVVMKNTIEQIASEMGVEL